MDGQLTLSEIEYRVLSEAKAEATPRYDYKKCILGKVVKLTSGDSCQLIAIFRKEKSRARKMDVLLTTYSTKETMNVLEKNEDAKTAFNKIVLNKIVLVKIRGPAGHQKWWATLYGLKDDDGTNVKDDDGTNVKDDEGYPNIKDISRMRPGSAKKSDLVNINRWLEQTFSRNNECTS